MNQVKKLSEKMRHLELNFKDFTAKQLAYRLPLRWGGPLVPKYRFGIEPTQLACLVRLIDENKSSEAAVCEIGVDCGYTSLFLLEHMRCTANPTRVVFVDTFSGFTQRSITYEVLHCGKKKSDIDRFRAGDPVLFEKHLRRLGYDNFKVIAGDCEDVDWESIAPISVVLLDVDLYLPTKRTLERIWPYIISDGACLVDDCKEGGPFDGALRAYSEFIEERNMPFVHVGSRGGLLRKVE